MQKELEIEVRLLLQIAKALPKCQNLGKYDCFIIQIVCKKFLKNCSYHFKNYKILINRFSSMNELVANSKYL